MAKSKKVASAQQVVSAQQKPAKAAKAALAPVQPAQPVHAVEPAAAAPAAPKLTKRNATPTSALIGLGERVPRNRVGHTQTVWDAVAAALPATAAELTKVAEATGACRLPQSPAASYISYWLRRGYLSVQ